MIGKSRPWRIASGLLFAAVWIWVAAQVAAIGLARQAVMGKSGVLAHNFRDSNSRGTALAAAAQQAAGNKTAAEALARHAVAASPIDAVAIRTLAEIRNELRPGSGDALMIVAAQLGWRDQPAQLWVIDRALRAGQIDIAHQRVEALARRQRDSELTFSLLRLVALSPRGMDLTVNSLARRPLWRINFFYAGVPGSGQTQLTAMATILRRLRQTEAPASMAEARATIDALATEGMVDEAYRLYREFAGDTTQSALVSDGGFERTDTDYRAGISSTVFDWRIYNVANASAGIEVDAEKRDNKVLFGTVDGTSAAAIAGRSLVLSPGRYELTYRIRSAESRQAETLQFTVRCADRDQLIGQPSTGALAGGSWRGRSARFEVPPVGCASQLLELRSSLLGEGRGEYFFDDIAIRRLS
jgi:hypothetical protein